MKNIIFFDDARRNNLLPLTFIRPVSEIRIGILTIAQKWERMLKAQASYITQDYLSAKYPLRCGEINCLINGGVCPDPDLIDIISNLKLDEALMQGDVLIAGVLGGSISATPTRSDFKHIVEYSPKLLQVSNLWDIFMHNGEALERDFEIITHGRKSQPIPESNRVIGAERIFIEPGAKVELAILNASSGPIYIGRDAEVMEGSIIRGAFALCEHSATKIGAKVYGPTTVGPYSKIGGEVNNSVIFGYSNKAHDGFLGNSVVGEWCNIGADTNNSNLKNNYAVVKLWNYPQHRFVSTGLQFCGLILGDHSKCGINTMFNTGTVVGISANIFGSGFPRNFIPSFAWGGAAGLEVYSLRMAFDTASAAMERRGLQLSQIDRDILEHVFSIENAGM